MTCETALRFVLAALASWRLSVLLVRESGPWNLLVRLRTELPLPVLRKLFVCVKCTSLWVTLPFTLFVGGTWPEMFVEWLALAGVVAIIDESLRSPFEVQDPGEHP